MAKDKRMEDDSKENVRKGKYSKKKNSNKSYKKDRNQSSAESKSSASPSFRGIENIVGISTAIAPRNIAGNEFSLPASSMAGADGTCTTGKFTVPGVFAPRFHPVFGIATGSQTDPVNLAARNVWMNLRSLYSNKIPYTAGAILMYTMGMDSLMMAFQLIKRAYGIVFAYDSRNRYVCDGILRGMGIDPVDFRANLPEIKVYLNRLSTQLTVLGVPAEFKFVIDHVDACAHLYVDDDAINAQYIVLMPYGVWKNAWATNKLTYSLFPGTAETPVTWSTLQAWMDDLVESFLNYEDVYMIASDMQRMYGNLMGVGPVDESYAIGPEYDPEFLEIMHNATWPINEAGMADWTITELQAPTNVGAISASYATGWNITNTLQNAADIMQAVSPGIFDFDGSDPSADLMYKTCNFKFALEPVKHIQNEYHVKVATCGTMMLATIDVVWMDWENPLHKDKRIFYGARISWKVDTSSSIAGANPCYLFLDASYGGSKFPGYLRVWNRHPLIPHFSIKRTVNNNVATYDLWMHAPEGQYDQYLTVDIDELKRVHEAIVLDRFDAAGVGLINLKSR